MIYFPVAPANYVHDSIKQDVPVYLLPISMYLLEHACTTCIHREFSKVYGHDMLVGLEIEMSIGASADDMEDWDWNIGTRGIYTVEDNGEKKQTSPCLLEIVEEKLDKGHRLLHPEYWTDARVKANKQAFLHNLRIITKLRNDEIKETLRRDQNPATIMHMTEENARSLGLIFQV